jgi:phage terminase large subunit-like protein
MLIGITTAGYDTTGICYQQRNIGSNVLSPSSLEEVIAGDSFFAYIACIDEPDKEGKSGDDPFNETCWIKANPNLGVSVKLDDLRVEAGLAKIDASALNSFLCKKLNVWVNQEFRWMDPSRWAQCSAAGTLANPKELRAAAIKKLQGRMAIGGLDLSEKFDLSAFALVFPPVVAKIERVPRPQTREQIMFRVPIVYDEVEMEPADPNWSVLVWFWVPKDKIQERVKKDRVMYDVWARDEYLMTCPGSVIDHEVILKHIVELKDKFAVRDIGYDEWNAAWISKKLDESGFTTVKVPMTYGRMSEPMKNLMAAVLEHKLEHYGDPILSWNAGNVSATTNANGDIRPDKEKSKEKIDGIVAIIIALSLVCANPKLADDRGGAWDYSRGIVFI